MHWIGEQDTCFAAIVERAVQLERSYRGSVFALEFNRSCDLRPELLAFVPPRRFVRRPFAQERCHARNKSALGTDRDCFRRRGLAHLDCDPMDGLAPWLSTRTRPTLDARRKLAALPSAGLLLVVVRVRRLRAAHFCRRRLDRGIRRPLRRRHLDRHVGLASPRGEGSSYLRL